MKRFSAFHHGILRNSPMSLPIAVPELQDGCRSAAKDFSFLSAGVDSETGVDSENCAGERFARSRFLDARLRAVARFGCDISNRTPASPGIPISMGITFSHAGLLAQARQKNVRFDSILTIGHLNLYLSRDQIRTLANRYGVVMDESEFTTGQYANRFLESFLAAKNVLSLDYSDYEQCDIVHDMNHPVDPAHHDRFDVVIDGGSLEHIFHFPVAVANCMKMVKPGGSLFIFTMANNHMGHGFYQFSPELFFRVFQPDNGFEIQDLILEMHDFPGSELSRSTRCYSVVDPASVKSRVGLVSRSPVMMMVHAKKTETKPLFTQYPIQSDYSSRHHADEQPSLGVSGPQSLIGALRQLARRGLHLLPSSCQSWINGQRQLRHYSFSNTNFYKRWYPV